MVIIIHSLDGRWRMWCHWYVKCVHFDTFSFLSTHFWLNATGWALSSACHANRAEMREVHFLGLRAVAYLSVHLYIFIADCLHFCSYLINISCRLSRLIIPVSWLETLLISYLLTVNVLGFILFWRVTCHNHLSLFLYCSRSKFCA